VTLNIGKELTRLRRMAVRELRTRYAEVFGEETRPGSLSESPGGCSR
jgi:hypothetical protein